VYVRRSIGREKRAGIGIAITGLDASCAQNTTILLLLLLFMHSDLVRFYTYKPIRIWIMSFICINNIYIYHDNGRIYTARSWYCYIIVYYFEAVRLPIADCPNNRHKFGHLIIKTKNTGYNMTLSYERR